MICPRCGNQCSRDTVHNGLALLEGPWGCECGWSEYEEYDQTLVTQPSNGYIDQWGGFTPLPAKNTPRVIQCSTCDNREELSGEITAQTLIDDNWLLEPVVYCPKHGPDKGEPQ